jgi:trehalose 6-phosphate synthase
MPIPTPDQIELIPYFTAMETISRNLAMQCIDPTNCGYLVNDFQLARVPNALKESGKETAVTFFLHTPWPKVIPQDACATRILEFLATGMLAADVIQFQTQNDLQAFENFVFENLPTQPIAMNLEVNPASVNVQGLHDVAKSALNQMDLGESDISYVHIARTDPIKNTLPTILAFTEFVKDLEDSTTNNYLDLYLVPSRQQWPDYQLLLSEIVTCVELCNLELAALNYNPIRLHVGNDYQRASQALARYDYLLVCSIADGLNLVVKEGAALNNRNGVIVSSPHVGAMAELGNNCVLVDGVDQGSISIALKNAANLTDETRQAMSKKLKLQVSEFDVKHWAKSVVASLKILEKV